MQQHRKPLNRAFSKKKIAFVIKQQQSNTRQEDGFQ